MALEPRALLVAEIGCVTTRVTLVDAVEGETRLIGQAEVPSTVDPPYENALIGILEAAVQIGEVTGRQLLREGELLMPQTSERDGVDGVLVITSAAGLMNMVIAAVARDVSARSAMHACRTTYTSVLQVVTLDDTGVPNGQERSWIERQVQALTTLQTDVVLLAGGLEHGAHDSLKRLAHIVGLTALSARVDTEGQQRQEITTRPVIFAGNNQARDTIVEALSGRAELIVVDNLRPTLEIERLEPARRAITRLYNERILPRLPGIAPLQQLCRAPIHTSCDAIGLMTRFIAEQYGRAVLTVDVGSASSAAYLQSQGRYSPVVLGGVGTGYGVGTVFAKRGLSGIRRWLPFPISEPDLTHWLLNKMIRPQLLPSTREDLLIEHAVVREVLTLVSSALENERPSLSYDLIVASGGVLAHAAPPGLAALSILDALQPTAVSTDRMIEIHLDTMGLMGTCGALAFTDADAALTLFERDLMRNTPLATCVVALGSGRLGEPAIEVELRHVGGRTEQLTVHHGQVGRLALPPGRYAQLILRPASGVRIGRNGPGVEVTSDPGDIRGSLVGVLIDARGRPLRLPEQALARQQALWDWMVSLGIVTGPLPYPADDAPPEILAPEPESIFGSTIFVESIPPPAPPPQSQPQAAGTAQPAETAPRSLDNDLAKLRQTVQEPKKKGFFRRK